MNPAVKRLFRGIALMLLAVMAVSAVAGEMEEGVVDAGDCWDAFLRCADDPILKAFNLTHGLYCLNGYVFCMKYVVKVKG
jgi:hypothetical protein